jgi:ribosomal-protein-serine acetyltransferase
MEFKKIIKDKELELRLLYLDVNVAKDIFECVNRNREYLGEWLPWVEYTQKIEDTIKYLVESEKKIEEKKEANYWIYIDGKYSGNISLMHIDPNTGAEIGYWIDKEKSGKGYARRAVKLIEKEGFENNLNRIQIKCDEQNNASKKVIEKSGYFFEGKLREDDYSKNRKEFRNTLIYSKLKKEYTNE